MISAGVMVMGSLSLWSETKSPSPDPTSWWMCNLIPWTGSSRPGASGRGRGSRPPAGGAYSDGQTVSVSTGPNSFFHPYSRVVILECADPESDEAPTPLGHGIGATPSAGVASVLPVCACTLRRPWAPSGRQLHQRARHPRAAHRGPLGMVEGLHGAL